MGFETQTFIRVDVSCLVEHAYCHRSSLNPACVACNVGLSLWFTWHCVTACEMETWNTIQAAVKRPPHQQLNPPRFMLRRVQLSNKSVIWNLTAFSCCIRRFTSNVCPPLYFYKLSLGHQVSKFLLVARTLSIYRQLV